MARNYYSLPSLMMLSSFEAAARHRSFKEAASELGVTASAVSHQIKALEDEMGVALFDRSHRSVDLTLQGQLLAEASARGFAEISRAVSQIRAENEAQHVSIGATTAVSSLWLTPRITQFWREHGHVTITQEVRDRPFVRPIDLDLVIEYALDRPSEAASHLFSDELLPLVSPDFADHYENLADLAQAPLIHLDAKETNWTSWPKWFGELGYTGPLQAKYRVNNYQSPCNSPKTGQGLCLAGADWSRLCWISACCVRCPILNATRLGLFTLWKSLVQVENIKISLKIGFWRMYR